MEGMYTFALVRDSSAAAAFLATLSEAYPSINFTMETAANEIITTGHHLETSVCTERRLSEGYFSITRATSISDTNDHSWWQCLTVLIDCLRHPDLLSKECRSLKAVFLKLRYPERFIDSTISRFNHSLAQDQTQTVSTVTTDNPIRIILPFKDQISADIVRRDLRDLSAKINKNLQPIFVSRKLIQDLRLTADKPSLVNQQCVVYEFKCNLLCDSSYVGYTRRHLFNALHSFFL